MFKKTNKPKKAVDSFEKLAKDEKCPEGDWGGLFYSLDNGGPPCYISHQEIHPEHKMSVRGMKRYIKLCQQAAPKNTLLQFTVTEEEPMHQTWLDVFCQYMDEGATLLEAQSKNAGRYKCWLFIIHATGK